jgi:tetratricopeptide (TPR) repeat protein
MSFIAGEMVGPYRIIEQLGQGGMATVFKAYHANLDRYVAIKVLHPAFKQEPNFLARFQREARIVANLEHPNIVPVYDFSEHQGAPYLVMRYIEGKTLKEHLRGRPVPLGEVLTVLQPVCQALAYAHGQNVLHRDIKPSNIILTGDGHVFLADFGLARIAQSGESSLTKDMMVGTPQYISPEQAKGISDLDARTDIYSLSVVLFEMLTGRVPFSADTPYAVIHDHIFSPLPLPRSINPDIPPEVEQVLLKGLAKERDDRFASVEKMLESLERAIEQADTVASPPPPPPVTVAVPTKEEEKEPEITEALVAEREPQVAEAPAEEKKPFLQRYRWPLLGGAAILLLLCCLAGAVLLPKAPRKDHPTGAGATPATPALSQPADTPAPPALLQPGEPPTPAQPAPPPPPNSRAEAEAHLQHGSELGQAGDVKGALQEYERAVELDPKLAEAYARAGTLLMSGEGGRPEEALNWFERGLKENPDNPGLHLKAGQALAMMNRWPEAAEHFKQVTEVGPLSAEAHAGLAYCYIRTGDLAGARKELQIARRINPELPLGHLVSGLVLVKAGDFDAARREFELVIGSPDSGPWLVKVAQQELKMMDEKAPPGPKPKESPPPGPPPEPKP